MKFQSKLLKIKRLVVVRLPVVITYKGIKAATAVRVHKSPLLQFLPVFQLLHWNLLDWEGCHLHFQTDLVPDYEYIICSLSSQVSSEHSSLVSPLPQTPPTLPGIPYNSIVAGKKLSSTTPEEIHVNNVIFPRFPRLITNKKLQVKDTINRLKEPLEIEMYVDALEPENDEDPDPEGLRKTLHNHFSIFKIFMKNYIFHVYLPTNIHNIR